MEIFREFTFEAAHSLPNVPRGHKCSRIHGHSYHVSVHVEGEVDERLGWVMDFGTLKRTVQPLIDRLDHHYLNDLPGLDNPTSENVARWLWWELMPFLKGLSAVTIRETNTSGCTYRGTQ